MDQHIFFVEGRALTPEEVAEIEARKQEAIHLAQKTPGTQTKHIRLSINFHITIAGIPPEHDGMNEPDPIYHARQARLLTAVKNNPQVLKRWIDSLIADQMRQRDWSYWDELLGGDVTLQELLAPALAVLPKDDQEHFADIPQYMYFDEMIDLFSGSFTLTEDTPVIEHHEGGVVEAFRDQGKI